MIKLEKKKAGFAMIDNLNNLNNQNDDLKPEKKQNGGSAAALIPEKEAEIASLKKLMILLSLTVVGVILTQKLLGELIIGVLNSLAGDVPEAVESTEHTVGEFASNFVYFFVWLVNHLIVLAPGLLIFGLAFGKKARLFKPGFAYVFKKIWVVPFFLASFCLSAAAIHVSNFIEFALRPVFGSEGLPDVFENVMPQTSEQTIIMLIFVGVIGPVCEELIYRRLLLKPLRRYGDFSAVIITSLLFGFFHGNPSQFLYTTVAGVVYGIVAVKANSAIPAMVMHIINNCFFIFSDMFFNFAFTSDNLDFENILNAVNLGLIALGFLSFVLLLVKKQFKIENHNAYIAAADRVRIILENPLVFVMIVVLITNVVLVI